MSTLRRMASATAGLALLLAMTGCGGDRQAPPSLNISSPAFADGAPIPVQFSCKGDNVAPPLAWSAPPGAAELALVVDDPDAVRGPYVHWIVTGIAPGPGSTTAGQTPDHGRSLVNSGGQQGYSGPCPPAGTGTHHYRFTLYQFSAPLKLPSESAGVQAAQAITQSATAQARLTGTLQG